MLLERNWVGMESVLAINYAYSCPSFGLIVSYLDLAVEATP